MRSPGGRRDDQKTDSVYGQRCMERLSAVCPAQLSTRFDVSFRTVACGDGGGAAEEESRTRRARDEASMSDDLGRSDQKLQKHQKQPFAEQPTHVPSFRKLHSPNSRSALQRIGIDSILIFGRGVAAHFVGSRSREEWEDHGSNSPAPPSEN